MTTVSEDFTDYTAPPGHVTFSALDQEHNGHSVSIASKEYHGVVRAAKTVLSDINAATVFKGAVEQIRRSVVCTGDGCQRDDDDQVLLGAFIGALLKHPDKPTRRKLKAAIADGLKKNGGAHIILIIPPTGPSAWLIADPSNKRSVH